MSNKGTKPNSKISTASMKGRRSEESKRTPRMHETMMPNPPKRLAIVMRLDPRNVMSIAVETVQPGENTRNGVCSSSPQ